ncbi:hypothetical protein C2S53_007636 [Perilla frutescens var. hirtella]|uniref:Leucine-rich repeat-containing N-terminal plant-type domain-containing protein n=1 Tax=Perilla frutescens var. hirtella TaxID=608512 RepID=A0AAD4PE57_PERFH|nr:hypothetical protein C2S53_007636 [Perilla frutescens var. hirtella]
MLSHEGIAVKFLVVVLLCVEQELVLVSGDVCIEREREALLSFKEGLIDEYGVLSSWGSDEDRRECCEWHNVVCSNTTGHVISLLLRGVCDHGHYCPLRGKVSSSLLELRHLTYLDLSLNDFGGDRFPEFICSLNNLQHLNLQQTFFSGTVPPQLGNLTNLITLDLSENCFLRIENLNWLSSLSLLSRLDLSGSFDLSHTNWLQQILKLRSLQGLNLSSSDIADVRPSQALFVNSSSTSLSILDLSYNYLTSSIFEWLSNLSSSFVSLDLSHNKLHGIPKSLEKLSSLQILSLSDNNLGGPLEDFFGNLSSKGMISGLREVFLGGNNFTGLMPFSLSQLSEIQVLDVSSNALEGNITEAYLMKLHSLQMLDLSFNPLTLHIASDWTPPFQLYVLSLGGCNMGMHFDFPKWIQTQRKLFYLDLSNVGISDQVPDWLWIFSPRMAYLNLSHNQIRGTLPDFSSSSIITIDVSNNELSGHVPSLSPDTTSFQLSQNMFSGTISSICTISYRFLTLLDLSNNRLEGEIPNCWSNMTQLMILDVANNTFFGNIPHTFGSLWRLISLRLRDNNLSGELPLSLKKCPSLEMIDIGGNMLTGNIPAWIGTHLTKMKFMILRGNRFYGSIPPEICNLAQIQILDLAQNNISGGIPKCFDNFSSFVDKRATWRKYSIGFSYPGFGYVFNISGKDFTEFYYDYALVQWKGQELEYKKTLGLVKLIDLSSNKLVGNIPRSFSSMRALISLNLSRNSLTGDINPDIGQMEMLECLDLSSNKLSGEIPTGLAQLHYLAVLDLSNNNLWGEIPSGSQLDSFTASVYDGNGELCGRPLIKLCRKDGHSPAAIKNIKTNMTLSFMQEFCISMAFGFIIGFWGVVGSLFLKKSWRCAYFNSLDTVGDWLYVTTTICLSKLKGSLNKR